MTQETVSNTQSDRLREELVEDICSWDVESQHRTGTDGDLRTSESLMKRLTDSDVSPQIVEFPFTRRIPTECFVEIGGQRCDGIPLFDGGETDGILETSLVTVGQTGAIGLGYAAASGGPGNHALLKHRDSGNHEALIGIARSAASGIAMLNADAFTNPFGVPVLIVDGENEETLIARAQCGASVRLSVEFKNVHTTATNVEVRVAGRNKDLAPLVVMTPKSSWWTSTAERCGGIAAWLASIRELASIEPERDVIFTANTGHELGHVGLEYFLTENPRLARDAHTWVHLGANFASEGSQIRMQYSNDALRSTFVKHLRLNEVAIASEVGGNIRPGGEARNVYDANGTYVSILGSNRLFHHPDDRMSNNVDIQTAMRTRNAVVDLVKELSGAEG